MYICCTAAVGDATETDVTSERTNFVQQRSQHYTPAVTITPHHPFTDSRPTRSSVFFHCTAILSVLNSTNELDIGAEQLMMTRHPLKELLFYLTCLKFVSVQKKTIGNVSCSRHGLINQQLSKAKCSFHLPHSDQLWQTHFTCMYM